MRMIKKLLGTLDPSYLIRHYLFGILVFGFMIYSRQHHLDLREIIYLTASLVLYPFSMFVYDNIVAFLLGDNILIQAVIVKVIWVTIRTLFIFLFSIFIAPIGILYLLYKAGTRENN